MEIIGILKKNTFFSGLEDKELAKLIENLRKKKVEKNKFVIKENEISTEMYLIVEGKVNVVITNDKGKEMILATLHEGDIFGELSLLDDEPRAANIVTQEESLFLVLNKACFFDLLNHNPKFAVQVIKYLCHRLRLTNRTAESFALLNAYERLKQYFESVAVPSVNGKFIISTNESQEAIASRIGCSREMVSRILKKLKKNHQCLTCYPNKIILHKPLPLKL